MLWDINEIQFARLIDEIISTHKLDLASLADEMDIELSDIDQLLDRANKVWEKSKADVHQGQQSKLMVDALMKENDELRDVIVELKKKLAGPEKEPKEKVYSYTYGQSRMLDAKDKEIDSLKKRENVLCNELENLRLLMEGKLGLGSGSTWESITDAVTHLRTKNGHLARELNKELERYAKLDDVRYELEVKFKHLNDKHGILMANYHELEEEMNSMRRHCEVIETRNANLKQAVRQQVVEGMIEDDVESEPYLGDPPYVVRVPGMTAFAEFLHEPPSAFSSWREARNMGLSNALIIDCNEDDVTDAICKKFENHGAK